MRSDSTKLLLETLRSFAGAAPAHEFLSASQVNRLGNTLGLTSIELLRLLDGLSKSREIELEWGGGVRVAKPNSVANNIYLGAGATFVQNAQIGAGAAVGSNAMAAGAVRNSNTGRQEQLDAIAKLTAAVALMSESLTQSQGETRDRIEGAIKEMQGLLPELRRDEPGGDELGSRLEKADKALGVLSKATTVASATMSGLPHALILLQQGVEAAYRFIGSF